VLIGGGDRVLGMDALSSRSSSAAWRSPPYITPDRARRRRRSPRCELGGGGVPVLGTEALCSRWAAAACAEPTLHRPRWTLAALSPPCARQRRRLGARDRSPLPRSTAAACAEPSPRCVAPPPRIRL
jgi:hypothetical protein